MVYQRQHFPHLKLHRIIGIIFFLAAYLFFPPQQAYPVGEASTLFNIFVPPNDRFSHSQSMLLITAIESRSNVITTVDVVDDKMDGDDDDTQLGVKLTRGQTLIIYLNAGAVNDDHRGKADGDYFNISSDHPVIVSIATNSDWQHDWVPAENKKMIGYNFYIYSPRTSFSDRDINVFAYYDSTDITIMDITVSALIKPGITKVDFENPEIIIQTTLDEGQDLIHINKLGVDILNPGHTYYVQATKAITVQYGALYAEFNSARDGGGFVPSKNGYSSGDLFYFYIPSIPDRGDEREIRIVSFDEKNRIQLYGWDNGWQFDSEWSLDSYGFADKIAAPALCKVVCTPGKKVSVFEANWLETGASGTSDIASFLSSEHGFGAGKKFVCYMPPPGIESNSVDPFTGDHFADRYSHLYIFGHSEGTYVNVFDTKTRGDVIDFSFKMSKDEYVDAKISQEQYEALYNGDGNPDSGPDRPYLTIESNKLIAVMVSDWNDNWMTYATSVLLPNPETELGSDARQYHIETPITFAFTVRNIGESAYKDGQTSFTLPNGMEYIRQITPSGIKKPEITNGGLPDAKTGETTLSWKYNSMPAGGELNFVVIAKFISKYADGTPLLNDDMATAVTVSSGSYLGDFYETQAALAVKVINPEGTRIIKFMANMRNSDVLLSWITAFEHNNTGFKLYRSDTVDGTYTKINPALIPSQGDSDLPQYYKFTDTKVKSGCTYYYKLEDIDIAGISNFTGPISITIPAELPPEAPQNLAVSPGDSALYSILNWSPNNEKNLLGYNVYRSLSSNMRFQQINKSVISDTFFADTSLLDYVNNDTTLNATDYYYFVKAVNKSNQASRASNRIMICLLKHILPPEDLLSDDWNDWDYNDFNLSSQILECYNCQNQLRKVGMYCKAMSRGAMFQHADSLYFMGSGAISGVIARYDSLGNPVDEPYDTTLVSGADGVNLLIFRNSHIALPEKVGCYHINTHKDKPFVAGQWVVVKLTLHNPELNERIKDEALTAHINEHLYSLYDFKCHVISTNKTIYYGSKLHAPTEDIVSGQRFPASPLIGFSLKLTHFVPFNWYWPVEWCPIWSAYQYFEPYVKSGGTNFRNWFNFPVLENVIERNTALNPQHADYLFFANENNLGIPEPNISGWPAQFEYPVSASPAVADLDGDGEMEIIVGAYFNKTVIFNAAGEKLIELMADENNPAESMSSPTIADVDGDGQLEIIRGYDDYKLYIRKKDGSPLEGWPQATGGKIKSTAAVADLDYDGLPEVIVYAGDTNLYVWSYDGQLRPGWPQPTSGKQDKGGHIVLAASPAVADVDNDGFRDIAIAANDGKVYLFNHDGTRFKNWPQETASAIYSSPVLADLTGDSTMEIVAATLNGSVYIWKLNGELATGWPQQMFTGSYSSPAVGDLDNDGQLELVIGSDDGRVYAWHADGKALSHWPALTQSAVKSSPALADINSDGKLDVIVGSNDGKLYAFNSNATYIDGWPKSTPQSWIFSSPAIADIDGDSDLEVLVGSHDKGFYVWDEPATSAKHAIIWGMFRCTADHAATPRPDTTAASVEPETSKQFSYQLYQNYPNPFNPATSIKYSLAKPGFVKLEIINMLGQKVKTLVNQHQGIGEYLVHWNGLDANGKLTASGIYFCKLSSGTVQRKIKLLILK